MQTPETRVIHQCTHTPIKVNKEVFLPKQPFLIKGILDKLFNNLSLGKIVLDYYQKAEDDITGTNISNFKAIINAIERSWEGDWKACIKFFGNVEINSLVNFVQRTLEIEESILKRTTEDVQTAIKEFNKQKEILNINKNELYDELNNMRNTILSDFKNMFADIMPKENLPSELLRDNPEPIGQIMETVNTEMIYNKLNRDALVSAKVINAIFPVSPVIKADTLPQRLMEYTASSIESKRKTLQTLIDQIKLEPVGYLHLERLQFTPFGYDRGELVYSLPLLPEETIRLTHREWSRTETEFTKLVATSLETASEEAISENTELTQSSNTQHQYSDATNASVTVSGGNGYFNTSISTGYSCNSSDSSSRQSTSRTAQQITKKASSRAKKDSKITFKVSTTLEYEDQSYREIKNPLQKAVRWDFYRLMKKWRIDLYRYDIRMTYDIVIPEPGNYLLRKHIQLKNINEELSKLNAFNLSPSSISRDEVPSYVHVKAPPADAVPSSYVHVKAPPAGNRDPVPPQQATESSFSWEALSQKYGVSLDPPPEKEITVFFAAQVKPTEQQREGNGFINISLPDGYELSSELEPVGMKNEVEVVEPGYQVKILGKVVEYHPAQYENEIIDLKFDYNIKRLNKSNHPTSFVWEYTYKFTKEHDNQIYNIGLTVKANLTEKAFKQWQMECYERLIEAANAQYESKKQTLKQMKEDLQAELNREDALMLRKLEKEELMKGVLRWILGPEFDFYPKETLDLPDLSLNEKGYLEYYNFGTEGVMKSHWKTTLLYGEMIKFLQQAIEWENVNYILYPYFWTDQDLWEYKQFIFHSDYTHRNFLRAGAARVVLTIRPEFEKSFLSFMEGEFEGLLPESHRYMTAADEVRAMARTKYPYTKDANEENEENRVDTWYEYTPTGALDVVEGAISP